jgi:hypothetical protein
VGCILNYVRLIITREISCIQGDLRGIENATRNSSGEKPGHLPLRCPAFCSNVLWVAFSIPSGSLFLVNHPVYTVTPTALHCGQSGHNTTYNENLKLTSDVPLKKLLLFRGTPCVIRFVHVRQITCEIYRLEKTIAVSVL